MISRTIVIGIKDDCIGFHIKAALEQDVSREEVMETLGMAIYTGAGPSVMYASHAIDAFEPFSKLVSTPASTQA
jgi:alkylhydroperoxidase/carboxymuconolactone decarboxylase family protein YurZ